jgi:hypothetical protein
MAPTADTDFPLREQPLSVTPTALMVGVFPVDDLLSSGEGHVSWFPSSQTASPLFG